MGGTGAGSVMMRGVLGGGVVRVIVSGTTLGVVVVVEPGVVNAPVGPVVAGAMTTPPGIEGIAAGSAFAGLNSALACIALLLWSIFGALPPHASPMAWQSVKRKR